MYDLKKHLKLSTQIVTDAHRKANRYFKIAEAANKLNLKKLTKHYGNKALGIYIAALKLCNANIDLLMFGLDNNIFKKDV